jgi:hypothetical protein
MRYIERNPVRTGIAELPWEYPWSSADIHSGKRNNDAMLSMKNWTNCIGGMDWTAVLCEGEAEEELVEIRKKTQSGLPWADMAFIRKMEEKTGRRLGPAH